jgi:hypothetical protein
MKTRLFVFFTFLPFGVFAFSVLKMEGTIKDCVGSKNLKNKESISAFALGSSIKLKFEKNSQVLILDERVKKDGLVASYLITSPNNQATECISIKFVVANGKAQSQELKPANGLKVEFYGYRGMGITDVVLPPLNSLEQTDPVKQVPRDLPKKNEDEPRETPWLPEKRKDLH